MTEKKKLLGRPTKYKPEYCDMFIESCSQGNTPVQFAASISVAKSTVHQWRQDYPDFSDAFDVGRAKWQAWWENRGIENMENKDYKEGLHKFFMASWFGDYRSKQEIKTENVNVQETYEQYIERINKEEK